MKRLSVLASCILLIIFTLACQPQPQTPPDTRAADEAALRRADEDWSKAAGAKDVDKTVSYYADDALVLPPNGAAINTKDAIRKIWNEMLMAPGFSGGWKTTKVEVARSGEIGYVSGTWEFTMNDASGKPATDRGKFTEVWKKQADGSWKCVVDIWNSDLPLPVPAEKK
jgi:ketosteroid isomerase-like protein